MILPAHEVMPIVCGALQRGQHVRLTVTGSSMRPFIRHGEVVELAPAEGAVAFGDIVLARVPGGPYVIHRVIRVRGCDVWLRGDAQFRRQGPLPGEAVLGRVVTAGGQGRTRELARDGWRLAGRAWALTHPVGMTVRWVAGGLRRGISKVCRWGAGECCSSPHGGGRQRARHSRDRVVC